MNTSENKSTQEKSPAIAELALQLAEGLQLEREAISSIKSNVDQQLKALRNQDRGLIEETTLMTSQEVNTLQRLRNSRDELVDEMASLLNLGDDKKRLNSLVIALASELPDKELKSQLAGLAATLPAEAAQVKDSCKELAYSLQYALHLGHAMIEAVHGAASPPPVQVYTAKGNKELSTSRRMMINQVG